MKNDPWFTSCTRQMNLSFIHNSCEKTGHKKKKSCKVKLTIIVNTAVARATARLSQLAGQTIRLVVIVVY